MSTTDFWYSSYNLLDKLAGIHIDKLNQKYENFNDGNSDTKVVKKVETLEYIVEDCEVD